LKFDLKRLETGTSVQSCVFLDPFVFSICPDSTELWCLS
jgi:hypothetical protein